MQARVEKIEGRKMDLTQRDAPAAFNTSGNTSMNAPVDTAPTDWVSSEDVAGGDERLQTQEIPAGEGAPAEGAAAEGECTHWPTSP